MSIEHPALASGKQAVHEVSRRPERTEATRERPNQREIRSRRETDKPEQPPGKASRRGPEHHTPKSPENKAYETRLFKNNERAMRDTVENAEVRNPDKANKRYGYHKIQGKLGESLHHYHNGGGIGLVNDLNNELGTHSEVFDSSSSREMASIKTHLSNDKTAPGTYAQDLREMVRAQNSHKHDALTEKLWVKREAGGREWAKAKTQLPESVAEASTRAEMKTALVDEAVLRIPADQVQATRDHVVRNAMRSPELYGIDAKAPPAERQMRANMLAMKVRPLAEGISSHDLRVMTRECYQRRFSLK